MRRTNLNIGGFTLLELMISIAVLAVLAVVALPNFSGLIQRNSISTDTNELVSFINLARSEAIKRNRTVNLEAKSGDWGNGYSVKVNSNSELLRDFTPGDNNTAVEGIATPKIVSFAGSGLLIDASKPSEVTTIAPSFRLCKKSGDPGRLISVSTTGRISTEIIPRCP